MSDLSDLMKQEQIVLNYLHTLDQWNEGPDNKYCALAIQNLKDAQAKLPEEKSLQTSIKNMNITHQIHDLSVPSKKKILDCMKDQCWYFFENNEYIIFDIETGIIWANPVLFPWCPDRENLLRTYTHSDAEQAISSFSAGIFTHWEIPKISDLTEIVGNGEFLFDNDDFSYWSHCHLQDIKHPLFYCMNEEGSIQGINLLDLTQSDDAFYVLPCSKEIVQSPEYQSIISRADFDSTDDDYLQYILDLFVRYGLIPYFDDQRLTGNYKQLYIEKPQWLSELNRIRTSMSEFSYSAWLSSLFNTHELLEKYDIDAIDSSVVKYYQSIQTWCDDLLKRVEYFESRKLNPLRECSLKELKLFKQYTYDSYLSDDERSFLIDRQHFFQREFGWGMDDAKNKILAIKKDADEWLYRINQIDKTDNPIQELAKIEQANRASFPLVAESTLNIVKKNIAKMDFIENHLSFVIATIKIGENWTSDYLLFRSTYKTEMKMCCEGDLIEEEIWDKWYNEWQYIRFNIESRIQPLVEYGLKGDISTINTSSQSVISQLESVLNNYKQEIDSFYREERKGIYQKYAFIPVGDLQEKLEVESRLYEAVSSFYSSLQDIIFNCLKTEDRVWILNWASSLIDFQIDEVISITANSDMGELSRSISDEFTKLKKKNFDIFLMNAKTYSAEQARRDREYHSLIFRMRKELQKIVGENHG